MVENRRYSTATLQPDDFSPSFQSTSLVSAAAATATDATDNMNGTTIETHDPRGAIPTFSLYNVDEFTITHNIGNVSNPQSSLVSASTATATDATDNMHGAIVEMHDPRGAVPPFWLYVIVTLKTFPILKNLLPRMMWWKSTDGRIFKCQNFLVK